MVTSKRRNITKWWWNVFTRK